MIIISMSDSAMIASDMLSLGSWPLDIFPVKIARDCPHVLIVSHIIQKSDKNSFFSGHVKVQSYRQTFLPALLIGVSGSHETKKIHLILFQTS